jgi:hypothetical protein
MLNAKAKVPSKPAPTLNDPKYRANYKRFFDVPESSNSAMSARNGGLDGEAPRE